MTKHDPANLAAAKADPGEAVHAPETPATEAPALANAGTVVAKNDQEKKHGPTTTMMSGWASGGSAAG